MMAIKNPVAHNFDQSLRMRFSGVFFPTLKNEHGRTVRLLLDMLSATFEIGSVSRFFQDKVKHLYFGAKSDIVIEYFT